MRGPKPLPEYLQPEKEWRGRKGKYEKKPAEPWFASLRGIETSEDRVVIEDENRREKTVIEEITREPINRSTVRERKAWVSPESEPGRRYVYGAQEALFNRDTREIIEFRRFNQNREKIQEVRNDGYEVRETRYDPYKYGERPIKERVYSKDGLTKEVVTNVYGFYLDDPRKREAMELMELDENLSYKAVKREYEGNAKLLRKGTKVEKYNYQGKLETTTVTVNEWGYDGRIVAQEEVVYKKDVEENPIRVNIERRFERASGRGRDGFTRFTDETIRTYKLVEARDGSKKYQLEETKLVESQHDKEGNLLKIIERVRDKTETHEYWYDGNRRTREVYTMIEEDWDGKVIDEVTVEKTYERDRQGRIDEVSVEKDGQLQTIQKYEYKSYGLFGPVAKQPEKIIVDDRGRGEKRIYKRSGQGNAEMFFVDDGQHYYYLEKSTPYRRAA